MSKHTKYQIRHGTQMLVLKYRYFNVKKENS